jgi:hypothetical protein
MSLGAASIRGHDVADNWNVDATAGGYWRILDIGQGGLSLGVSATGIHYDKNLNFFSLGQGGYFSPQQYLLGSIPVSWRDRRAGVAYEFNVSGGFQSIREDPSPYYPTRPLVGQPYYESHVTTGPNYNFAAHLEYQASSHLYIEGFATANNARNYASQAVGVGIKLLIERLPTSTNLRPRALPDWRGKPPFGS